MADKDDNVAALGAPVGRPHASGRSTRREDASGEVADPSPPMSHGGRSESHNINIHTSGRSTQREDASVEVGDPSPPMSHGGRSESHNINIHKRQCQEDYDERQASQVITVTLITPSSL